MTQNRFIFSFFNSVGFIDFVLDLLPLCLFWIYFSHKKMVLIKLSGTIQLLRLHLDRGMGPPM